MDHQNHPQDQQPPVRRRRSSAPVQPEVPAAAAEQPKEHRSQALPKEQVFAQPVFDTPAAKVDVPRKRSRRTAHSDTVPLGAPDKAAKSPFFALTPPAADDFFQPENTPVQQAAIAVPVSAAPQAIPMAAQKAETGYEAVITPEAKSAPKATTDESAEKIADPKSRQTFQYPSQYTSQRKKSVSSAAKKASPVQPEPPAEDASGSEAGQPIPTLRQKLPYYIGIALCAIVLIVSGAKLVQYYSQIHRANSASGQLRDLYRPAGKQSITTEAPAETQPADIPTAGPVSPDTQTAVAAQQPGQTSEAQLTSTPEPSPAPTPVYPAATDSTAAFLAKWPKKYPGNEGMRIQERFTPLRQQNRDVVGWLTIEGVVDEPVFQRNNSYYLTHDATGAKNPTGALFLDENCNLRIVPMQVLIHGHNMKEGAMFGSLKKYKVKDAPFYKEHPFITFDSLYESATYVIFAVAEVNIVPGNTHYFPFWHQFFFNDEEAFRQYVSLAKEYSRFKVDIDIQPGDRLLTLATCSSEDDNLRLIVMARMLRPDENKVMLANQIYSATAE